MPLGKFESEVLLLLAAQRSPDSYVGGATVLHQSPDSPRASQDVDLFHDEEDAVNAAAQGQDAGQLHLRQPLDFQDLRRRWTHAAEEALALIEKLPVAERGCFYLDANNKPVCPDPTSADFADLTRHYGSVKGAWPNVAE